MPVRPPVLCAWRHARCGIREIKKSVCGREAGRGVERGRRGGGWGVGEDEAKVRGEGMRVVYIPAGVTLG